MSVPIIKFNTTDQPDFYKELRRRVNAYFKDKNISKHANLNMKIKSAFMLLLYFVPFALMLSGVVTGVWPIMGMWALMGMGMTGIGLSIMHDANHGSYSKSKRVNKIMAFTLTFAGGYPPNWTIQHNVLHHSYTNINGYDEDISKGGLLRLSPNQHRLKAHRFQFLYAPFLYSLLTLNWVLGKDFEQLFRYNKMGLLKAQGLTFKKAFFQILFHKSWYIALTLVLPMVLVDIAWWQSLLGFLGMHFLSGLSLALIFQTAHVLEETEFFVPDDSGCVENNWAIHQIKTTSNYSNGARMFSWFIGGLNYQVEHHLFPTICHVHFKDISKIVQKTAKEFNLPYNEHKTFYGALKSHFSTLYRLGYQG